MVTTYGYAKGKITRIATKLKETKLPNERQYHLHLTMKVENSDWDFAINVGTNQSNDLLKYKLVYDFSHPIINLIKTTPLGSSVVLNAHHLPALDFIRSDILKDTGAWRDSEPMDGSNHPEPVASFRRLLNNAYGQHLDVYIFGRFYREGGGLHDVHMNQGSGGRFVNDGQPHNNDPRWDPNSVWQDGALLVALEPDRWGAYFAAFQQQKIPTTDDLGNPTPNATPIV